MLVSQENLREKMRRCSSGHLQHRSFGYQMNGKQNTAKITNNQIIDSIHTVKQQVKAANKSYPSQIPLYGACMAVRNGFDNRFYVNVWEHKQDRVCTLSFEVWSYFNLFSLCPTNFGLVAALFIQRRTG